MTRVSLEGHEGSVSCLRVSLGSFDQDLLSGLDVLWLSLPRFQNGVLQCPAVRKGESPWSFWLLVDLVEVDSGL